MALPQLKKRSAEILKTLNVPTARTNGKAVDMSLMQNTFKMSVI